MVYKFTEYKKSPILRNHLNMGGENPSGECIDVNSLYFERNNKPWIGVMGEYHFSRAKREDWHRELCKMKAGGISIVSTYIFWIYHEETEGEFDFTDDRDIRSFINECKNVGLDVFLRIGPYAHGECRNGGFPDWLLEKPFEVRKNNDGYLGKTRIFYEKIYEQVKGLLYKNGGNIIGVQLENENVADAQHLAKLKELAVSVGFDVPIYTVTGWNNERGAEIPVDEVIPVFGGYPEAPWLKHTERLEPLCHFFFSNMRNEAAFDDNLNVKVFTEGWRLPYERYPFATCELGGGAEINHNRRPIISPMDVYSLSLIKLGSGNNLIGYYMYHGGTNKIGKLSTLNECYDGKWAKDCLIRSYDFQAPISEYGEVRESCGLLNMLHMFVQDFDDILAPMEYVESDHTVSKYDTSSLRYCMRTDGNSGFVFISHYQRLTVLDDIDKVVIDTGNVKFPEFSVKGDICFFMPFNMDLSGNILEYATAQPLCRIDNTYFFAAIDGIEVKYKFAGKEQFTQEPDSIIKINNIQIVALSWNRARYARKLSNKLYIGNDCDLYEYDGEICSVHNGDFSYDIWNGTGFEHITVNKDFNQPDVIFEMINEPFVPPYNDELNIGGERKRTWKKVSVSNDAGFIEIQDRYDVAQIYADGKLVADNFYYGKPWHIPSKLLYGKECYLVMSEMKDDFYKEF